MVLRRLPSVFVALMLLGCSSPGGDPPSSPPASSPSASQAKPHGEEGGMCGGFGGFQCAQGLTCEIPAGQCRTVADASGVCRKKPQICPMIYAPVCGCDGKTYPSACNAAAAGASVAAQGECKT